MPAPVVRTLLELTDPAAIQPARRPRVAARIELVDPPDGAVNQVLYEQVGAPHAWTDLREQDERWWRAWAEGGETWVAWVGDERAGYYELDAHVAHEVELAYFGLRPAFQGAGLGGHLLEHALRRAFALPGTRRVWVSTATSDGPHALANYEARGLVAFRRFTEPSTIG